MNHDFFWEREGIINYDNDDAYWWADLCVLPFLPRYKN